MANKTVNQLTSAAEPLLGTDLTTVSRDGVSLSKIELSKLPITTAASDAITAATTGRIRASDVNTFTKAQRSQIVALTAASNVYTPDFESGNFFSFTPTANFTLANPTNLPAAGITQSGSFFITQDATGSRTITFGNLFFAAGGLSTIVLSTAANARDRIDYVIGAAGNIHVSIAKDIKA